MWKCNAPQAGSEESEDYSRASRQLPRVPTIRAPNREKTPIEEHFDKYGTFELTSIEQETFEKYFYGTEHWNYFTQDEDLGPIILSLKQETINGRDQFRCGHIHRDQFRCGHTHPHRDQFRLRPVQVRPHTLRPVQVRTHTL